MGRAAMFNGAQRAGRPAAKPDRMQAQRQQEEDSERNDDDEIFDLDQFLFDKRSKLEHFFNKVHEEMSSQSVFALHFFLKFSKHLAQHGNSADEQSLELLRRAFKHITKDDIEVFLFYETDIAVRMVNELVENQSGSPKRLNAREREMKNLALKIKQCPNWRIISRSHANTSSAAAGEHHQKVSGERASFRPPSGRSNHLDGEAGVDLSEAQV